MIEVGGQGLAVYGAIVGTIALSINIFNFIHTKQKDSIRLSVDCVETNQASSDFLSLEATKDNKEWERPSCAHIYDVVVRNIGNTEAFIHEAGIVDKSGETHFAVTSVNLNDPMILGRISQIKSISIKAKASQSFRIYIGRDQPLFTPASCFVTDQRNETWKSKLKLKKLI